MRLDLLFHQEVLDVTPNVYVEPLDPKSGKSWRPIGNSERHQVLLKYHFCIKLYYKPDPWTGSPANLKMQMQLRRTRYRESRQATWCTLLLKHTFSLQPRHRLHWLFHTKAFFSLQPHHRVHWLFDSKALDKSFKAEIHSTRQLPAQFFSLRRDRRKAEVPPVWCKLGTKPMVRFSNAHGTGKTRCKRGQLR